MGLVWDSFLQYIECKRLNLIFSVVLRFLFLSFVKSRTAVAVAVLVYPTVAVNFAIEVSVAFIVMATFSDSVIVTVEVMATVAFPVPVTRYP